MGGVDEETGWGPQLYAGDGYEYMELTISRGSTAWHTGISLGRVDDDDTVTRALSLMTAALQGASALESAIGALPTPSGGPWPGVVAAAWLASLTTTQQGRLLSRIRARARAIVRV